MKPNGLKNIEDFIVNDLFVEWVLTPDEENVTFWASYLADFPEKMSIVEEAKTLVLQLNEVEHITAAKGDFKENWNAIAKHTHNTIPQPKKEAKVHNLNWWRYAAAIAGLFLVGILGYQFVNLSTPLGNEVVEVNNSNCIWQELKNTTATTTTLFLADGSKVILEPFSSLKYPSCFLKNQREVVLKGEAFFDIARDTTKPFVVYANETITKVLGTSFTIKAFEGEKEVEVSVKTGKVAVYAQVSSKPKKVVGASEKFIIRTDEQILIPIPNKKLEVTPNQTVVFNKVKADMQKMVSELPLPVKPIQQLQQFQFNEEPLSIVLEALGKAYGLEINFDANIANCLINTTLEDVSIFDKLDIICQAMDLKYEKRETRIHVSGTGCE